MTATSAIDTTIGTTTNNGVRVTRIYHCGELTVRVRVAHDLYRIQSFALAEVLTPARDWTKICETPPEEFHYAGRDGANKVNAEPTSRDLLALADQLARRAARILRVPGA